MDNLVDKKMKSVVDENGNYILNKRYCAILGLAERLQKAQIPFEIERCYDGWKLCYPSKENCCIDAVEHFASLGNERDCVETLGGAAKNIFYGADLQSKTADEMFCKIKLDYAAKMKQHIVRKRKIQKQTSNDKGNTKL